MKKMMIFTNHFYPENFKINDIVKDFAKKYDVSIVTQIPNYPKGSFFDGYGFFKNNKEKCDVGKVRRLPVIPRGNNNITLALNYISYTISSFIFSLSNRESVDCVFTYVTSPIFISWAGRRVAKKNNVPHVMYLLDLWPDSLFAILELENKFIKKILIKMCVSIYNQLDLIIVSSKPFINALCNYGIEREKIVYIPQHANEIQDESRQYNRGESLNIVFTGNIGEAQGLDILVEVAQILKIKNIKNIKFTIVGDGRYKNKMLSLISDYQLEHYFSFVDRVDSSKIPGILMEHDFAFISLQNKVPFSYTLPAKLQNYMAEGIPVIGAINGAAADVIKEADCGYCIENYSSQDLADLLIRLLNISDEELEKMSKNAIEYSKENFDKDLIFDRLKDEINKLIEE